MSSKNDIDINAFVDGELTPEERIEVLDALQHDPDLAREACELSNLKSQLQLAYANPPGLSACNVARGRPSWLAVAASVVMLAVGLLGGWIVGNEQAPSKDRLVLLDADGRGQAPATADSDETRIVFQLTTPDQFTAAELLDDVEQMLDTYKQEGKPLRVEIVSNGEGLDFLRESMSMFKDRIHEMSQHYANLTFVACKNTIHRVEVQNGVEVRIVPDAEIINSGVDYVVKRQREGWIYIRV
jgi:intracellular sulfur oxidation DsrE/DsrF family protein